MNRIPELNWLLASICLLASLWLQATAFAATASPAAAIENPAKPFPDSKLDGWQEKSFAGKTIYQLVEEHNITVLKASANKSASVLYKVEKIDLTSTPWLEWSWKIESIYPEIDELTRAGDDFPARIYVTAQTGFLPWDSIAINYVWSSRQPVDSAWHSPFTDKSKMVAVQMGDALVGQWVSQRRNIAEDFKQFFNVDVKQISGYAVMVDGDNSSQIGTAYFGHIDFVEK